MPCVLLRGKLTVGSQGQDKEQASGQLARSWEGNPYRPIPSEARVPPSAYLGPSIYEQAEVTPSEYAPRHQNLLLFKFFFNEDFIN